MKILSTHYGRQLLISNLQITYFSTNNKRRIEEVEEEDFIIPTFLEKNDITIKINRRLHISPS
jgi:hypothetical protein